MKKIAVFASGGGTDFQSVIDANEQNPFCEIACLVASKEGIGAIERAKRHKIPFVVYAKKDYPSLEELYASLGDFLEREGVEYIVLAGYLTILTEPFVKRFEDKIINIHPSLIPAFCGKGYYGLKVHRAVIEYGAKLSGCTVHFVNAEPDGGAILMQEAVAVLPTDTPEQLQERILQVEHRMLPQAVRALVEGRVHKNGRIISIEE